MSLNPIIKDLSGNGYDATCYNFSWSQMSGIGGYNFNFNLWRVPRQAIKPSVLEVTDHLVKMAGFQQDISLFEGTIKIDEETGTFHYPGMKIKVNGIKDCNISQLWIYGPGIDIYEDGEYEIPPQEISPSGDVTKTLWHGFLLHFKDKDYSTPNSLTIEQLPYYPNALISDGVDDYADAVVDTNFPVESGFTVIAKRTYTEEMLTSERYGSLVNNNASDFMTGAFSLEDFSPSVGINGFVCSNYGKRYSTYDKATDVLMPRKTTQITSNYFLNRKIDKGELEYGTNKITLFRNVDTMSDHNGKYILYSLAIFDRDLTTYEIELAKALYL